MRYNIPPGDPRLEQLTEADVVHDLLVGAYFDHLLRKASGDADADVEEAAQDPELAEAYRELEEEATSGKMREEIDRFLQSRAQGPPKTVISIKPGKVSSGG